MGLFQSSAISIAIGAIGTLITLLLTYSFNRYTKKTEAYRLEREKKEAESLKKKSQDDALIMLILRIELRYMIDLINSRGFYSEEERKRCRYMFDVYKERGGNGEIERDFLRLENLPYVKP